MASQNLYQHNILIYRSALKESNLNSLEPLGPSGPLVPSGPLGP